MFRDALNDCPSLPNQRPNVPKRTEDSERKSSESVLFHNVKSFPAASVTDQVHRRGYFCVY